MGNQLSQMDEQQHQHFIFVEVTQNIRFYKLDILYIFVISRIYFYMTCADLFDFWFDILQLY